MRKLSLTGVFLVISGALVCPAAAQEKNPFFQKDFAKSPLEEKKPQLVPTALAVMTVEATAAAAEAPPAEDLAAITAKVEALQKGDPTKAPDLTALEKTHKVLAIGGIVNALDKAHLQEKMKELAEVAERFDFDIGKIWAVGTIPNITQTEEMLFLVARNGVVEAAEEAPARYKVKLSPTWIVRTPEGEILLEGTGPLAQHFNLRGEFVEKPGSTESIDHSADKPVETPLGAVGSLTPVPSPVPTPTPTPDTLFGATQPRM